MWILFIYLYFQYVILPFLGLLTKTAITDCNLEKYINAIFMVVYTNLVSNSKYFNFVMQFFLIINLLFTLKKKDEFFYNKVMKMLEMLVERNSIADHTVSVEASLSRDQFFIYSTLVSYHLWYLTTRYSRYMITHKYIIITLSLWIFFLVIVRLLAELLRRIANASINERCIKFLTIYKN